jgi:hypothetical protein
MACKTSQKRVKGYTRDDGSRVQGYCRSRSTSRTRGGRKSSCKRTQQRVKGYTREDGVRVKGHCRSVGKKSTRSRGTRSGGTRKCPEGTSRVRSHKHGSKKVKSYCRKTPTREEIAEVVEEIMQGSAPSQVGPDCDAFQGKNMCEEALDSDNMRRCRYNMTSKVCEDLPLNLRQRATFGVGGSSLLEPYQAPPRRRIQMPAFQQQQQQQQQVEPRKISASRIQELQAQLGGM